MFNFLYCFDNNYNIPAFCSIYSLLENVDQKINIYIMHKTMKDDKEFPKAITEHKNIGELNIYSVKTDNLHFPNIDGAHISEATYYRLLIEDYIQKSLDNIIYLDCDVVCVTNPLEKLEVIFDPIIIGYKLNLVFTLSLTGFINFNYFFYNLNLCQIFTVYFIHSF